MHFEVPGMAKIAWHCDRFLHAHVSNDCRTDLHGSATLFHRSAWKCYLGSIDVRGSDADSIQVRGSAWKRMDIHPSSHNRSFFFPLYIPMHTLPILPGPQADDSILREPEACILRYTM